MISLFGLGNCCELCSNTYVKRVFQPSEQRQHAQQHVRDGDAVTISAGRIELDVEKQRELTEGEK